MVEATRKEFEFVFADANISQEKKASFSTAFREEINGDDKLYAFLSEKFEHETPEELAKRLDKLSLNEEPTNSQSYPLDLTAFETEAKLDQLLAFTVHLGQQDAINRTKFASTFTSYSEFTLFKQPVTELLVQHPDFLVALEAVDREV